MGKAAQKGLILLSERHRSAGKIPRVAVVGIRILARERDKREVAKSIVTQEEVPSMKPAVKLSNQSPLYLREWGSQPKRQKVRMRPEPSAGQTGQLRKEPHTAGGAQ